MVAEPYEYLVEYDVVEHLRRDPLSGCLAVFTARIEMLLTPHFALALRAC
jgi:hypothetical protein